MTSHTARSRRLLIVALSLNALLLSAAAIAQRSQSSGTSIVFVCEHGAAKSVIATAYFNKLAAERGLSARATFRGTTPQDALSVRTVEGLRADGVAIPSGRPTAISDSDVSNAS